MGVALDTQAPPGFAGLIIGLTVAGMITATGNIAGASLNPARTFGPYIMAWTLGGPNLWLFPRSTSLVRLSGLSLQFSYKAELRPSHPGCSTFFLVPGTSYFFKIKITIKFYDEMVFAVQSDEKMLTRS